MTQEDIKTLREVLILAGEEVNRLFILVHRAEAKDKDFILHEASKAGAAVQWASNILDKCEHERLAVKS